MTAFFLRARRIFPYGSERTMRVHGRRILLGHNTGDRSVMLRLIMSHCDGSPDFNWTHF